MNLINDLDKLTSYMEIASQLRSISHQLDRLQTHMHWQAKDGFPLLEKRTWQTQKELEQILGEVICKIDIVKVSIRTEKEKENGNVSTRRNC